MDLNEFESQVLAGEITDFEPYFTKPYDKEQLEQRYILAKNGIETDRVEKLDGFNTIVDIINDGLLPERYEEWKHHRHAGVRGALVDNGYFLDYLINDENEDIRRQIIQKEPRLGLGRLDNDMDRSVVGLVLERQTNDEIELDVLKAYLKAEKEYGNTEENYRYQALQLKCQAMQIEPTIIETTMTPAQLYATDSLLWAQNYTANKICRILIKLYNKPKTEESFNNALKEINDWQEFIDALSGTN